MRKARRLAVVVALTFVTSGVLAEESAPVLSFAQRVEAERAIQRVYHAHRIGETRGFEDAMPPNAIERRILRTLRESDALERFWSRTITAGALRRELQRIARDTRFPGRLEEVYAALDHDPILIQEALVRPLLTRKLVRASTTGGA